MSINVLPINNTCSITKILFSFMLESCASQANPFRYFKWYLDEFIIADVTKIHTNLCGLQ